MSEQDPQSRLSEDMGELQEATLDLVASSESGGPDAVVEQLLRCLVGCRLCIGASVWIRPLQGGRWIRHRVLGASGEWDCPPPGTDAPAVSGHDRLVVPLARHAAVVAPREPVDVDGLRDDREDAIECLTMLASSLLEPWDGSATPDWPRAPLPRRASEDPRRA